MKEPELMNKFLSLAEKINQKQIFVLISDDSNDYGINDAILKFLINKKKLTGIYVSLDKDYATLQKKFKDLRVKTSGIHFIEGVTKKKLDHDNCTFLSSSSLTEISIALTTAINAGDFEFLFFDSFDSLENSEYICEEKFIHYLINKAREFEIRGIVISFPRDQENKKLIAELYKFCDGTID